MRITYCKGTAAAGFLLVAALGSQAQAQGLGEITLDSALNEPLRAHIELLDTEDLDATQIVVALASQSEFQVAGIANNFLLGSLRFEVIKTNDGNDRIDVSSTQSINEPYLKFLLSVRWPNGRNLREYTLLLDLPVLNTNNNIPTPNPAVGNSVQNAVTPAAQTATVQSSAAEGGYVVQPGDTLYQIAEQIRPSNDVSVQQMMLAVQRANEDAFVNNNVNRILTGKVLRIPTNAEIALIDQAAAAAQVTAQNQELISQPLAANDSVGNNTVPVRDELTLLSGDQAGSDQAKAGSGDLDATIAALENELMLSEENLDRARLENLELTNRLAALQEQIDLIQNIIAIEDERIAQLQSELSTQSAATEQAQDAANSAAQAAGSAGLVGMLKYGVMALGGLLAVAVAALLYIRRRRAEALNQQAEVVALSDIDDHEPAERAGLAAMLSTLLERFRRSGNDDGVGGPLDEDSYIEPQLAAAPTIAAASPVAAVEPVSSKAQELLTGMGFTDEFLDLDAVLDNVDSESMPIAEPPTREAVELFTAAGVSTADAEASALLSEVDFLGQALDDVEQQEAGQEDAGPDDGVDGPLDEDSYIEPQLAAAPTIAAASPVAAVESVPSKAQELPTEMGLTDEFLDLDAVLDNVDSESMPIAEPPAREAAELSTAAEVSTTDAEASAPLSEVDLLGQALDDAEQQEAGQEDGGPAHAEEDFMRAPAATIAAPESFAFTTEAVDREPAPVVAETAAKDKPDVFEFTLPDVDAAEPVPVAEVALKEKALETFAFTAEPVPANPETAADDSNDALDVLSFDEDSVEVDDVPEEEGYTPASSQDTHDARLDLAVAYEAMGDLDGAVEILDEVIASGRILQVAEAKRLKLKWPNS